LILHERIRTTVQKARNVRPFVEKLVTLAKDPSIHHRRLAKSKLGNKHDAEVKKLFDVLGPRFQKRPGGYTRILKLTKRRLGDGGEQAIIEFVERTPKEELAAPQPATKATAAPKGEPKAKEGKAKEPKAKKGKASAAGASS
jgi:large subunit ribosomal protein L17